MDAEKVARRVKALRVERGWRQSDLAERAGVSATTVAMVEQARVCMGLDTACGIADALGCSLDSLACRKDWK